MEQPSLLGSTRRLDSTGDDTYYPYKRARVDPSIPLTPSRPKRARQWDEMAQERPAKRLDMDNNNPMALVPVYSRTPSVESTGVLSPTGRLLDCSPQFEALLGRCKSTMLGKSMLTMVGPEDRQRIVDGFDELLYTGSGEMSVDAKLRNEVTGRVSGVKIIARPVLSGGRVVSLVWATYPHHH